MADTLTFAVPVEWSKSAAYEQNIIVFVGKKAYTSLKAVPSGIEITDTSYWAETGVPTASEVSALRTRMDDAESSIAHLAALANPDFDNSLSSTMNGTGVKSVDERGGVVQATVDMTVSGAIAGWTNFATGLPAPTRSLYWQGCSMESAQSYKLRLDTTGALGVRTNGGAYIDTTITYIAGESI